MYRLYVEEKLSLGRKRGRRRRAGSRLALPTPTRPDQLWAMDIASDAFMSGRKFRTLNLKEGFTREALKIEPDTSLSGVRIVRVLEGLKQQGCKPEVIVIDNGAGFRQPGGGPVGLRERSPVALHQTGTPIEKLLCAHFPALFFGRSATVL